MMFLFPAAAAVTFGLLSWANVKRYAPFWAPALAVWALAIGREPSVVFLGLFLVPTIVLGVASAFKRLAPASFLLVALSDIVLGVALSIYQSKTALWTLPEVGAWGSGAGLAAGAAILRLGAAANVGDPSEGGLVSVAWWQGAMLAFWAGSQGAPVLVAGGVLLWGTASYYSHSNLGAFSIAGGVLAVAAGLGADVAGVVLIGLAGTALVLGERLASTWTVAILPLSLLTLIDLPSGLAIALAAVIFPGAWAAMSTQLTKIKPAQSDLPYLSGATGLVGFAFIAALASSFFTGTMELGELGIPVQALNAVWLLYGAGAAAAFTFAVTGANLPLQWEPPAPIRYSKAEILLPQLLPPVAWFTFIVAAGVAVRLLLAGFRTSFL